MQIKYSKLIVKDASGNLIQLLPETKVDIVLDSTSSFPIANSAVTQAINNISANISTYQGATTEAAGVPGFVPSATSEQKDYFLKGDGSWSQVTDTKVTNTLNTTALAYITGTTSSSTNTGEQVFDSNVYLTTTAGTLHATNFEGKLNNKAESDFVYTSGNQTISGQKTFSEGPYGMVKDMASGSTIDLSQGNVFKKTISANTTFTITNVPQGKVATFSLVLTNGGSKTITWPSSVNWGGDSPELNSSGTDVLTFLTPDGGTTWYGSLSVGGVPITYDSAISSSSQNAVQNQVIYSALNTKANDDNVVHLDGAETITGVKTFSNNININSLQYIGDRTFTIGTVDAGASSYLQINSLVDSKSVTIANQGTNNITLSTKGDITATGTVTANSFSGNGASVTNLNASNLSSGTVPIERLPAGALERLVIVSSLSAMYALTTNDVQLGDTVKDADTGIMYYVKDASSLNSEAGYEEYTAGAATSVPWSGVTGKPETYPATAHTHVKADITDFAHTHTSSNISALTGYTIATSVSDIAATDSLNTALGKLQKTLNGKQNTLSAMNAAEATQGTVTTARSITAKVLHDKITEVVSSWDANVVHLTGDEEISGTKTFNSTISGSITGNAATATKLAGPKHIYTTAASATKNWYRIANASTHQLDTSTPLHAQFMLRAYHTSNVTYYEEWFVDLEVYGANAGLRVLGGGTAPFSQVRVLYENTTADVTNTASPAIDVYLNYVIDSACTLEIEEIYNSGFTFLADSVLEASTIPTGYENRAQGPYANGIMYANTSDYATYTKINYSNISSNKTLAVNDTYAKRILNCTGTITLTIPSGNANTAWFWIKNYGTGVVTLHPASSSVYFDNVSQDIILRPSEYILLTCQASGKYTIASDGRQKYAIVGRDVEVGSATKHWFLVAETTVTTTYQDPYVSFKVFTGNGTLQNSGILTAHCRIDSTKGVVTSGELQWEYKNTNIDVNDFALTYINTSGTSAKIQIWYKNNASYAVCRFLLLSEALSSSLMGQPAWTLTRARKTTAEGDLVSLDTGFTNVIYSTLLTIDNPVNSDSTVVHLTGDETITGTKTFTTTNFIFNTNPVLDFSWSDLTKGTNPSSTKWANISFIDKNKNNGTNYRAACFEGGITTSGETQLYLRAYDWTANSATSASIMIAYPKGGTPYTAAPTPDTSDNSTKIATTAFVKAQGYITSFTDTLVEQNISTNNNTYPVLLTPTANANSNQGAKTSIFGSGVKVNPSTNTITANDFYGATNTITTNTIDVSTGTCFVKTITANCTLSFTNAPSNVFCCITLVLINGGSKTITWPSSVKWTNNTVPDFSTSGTDVITLMTYNGGTTWYATAACMGVTA